jgi:hypothetical protein
MTIVLNTRKKKADVAKDNLLLDTIETIFSFTRYKKVWIEELTDIYDIRVYTDEVYEDGRQITHNLALENLLAVADWLVHDDYNRNLKMGGNFASHRRVTKRQHEHVVDYLIESDNRWIYDDMEAAIGHLCETKLF